MKNFIDFEKSLNEAKGDALSRLIDILKDADLTENVECEIHGEVKLMNEYRILVEPDSDDDKFIQTLIQE